jgi:hypothetical protein
MGGNNKLTYNFGYTYNDDKAIILNSNYKRHLLSLKTDYKITNNIKFGLSTRYTHSDVLGAGAYLQSRDLLTTGCGMRLNTGLSCLNAGYR